MGQLWSLTEIENLHYMFLQPQRFNVIPKNLFRSNRKTLFPERRESVHNSSLLTQKGNTIEEGGVCVKQRL
jgi:hypothetical protein